MSGHSRLAAYCLALLWTACSAACGNDPDDLIARADGGGEKASAARTPAAGGFEFREAECAQCVTTSCKDEAEACAGDPLCKAFWSCRAACEDDALTCHNRCRTQGWQWGGGAYVAVESGVLEACLAQHCDACDAHHIVGAAGCERCAKTTCGDVDWSA